MTLENLIKTGKKLRLALGTTLALLTIAPQFNQNQAYAQSNKYSINNYKPQEKKINPKKVSMGKLLRKEKSMIGDIDVANNGTIAFEYRMEGNSDIYILKEGVDSATQLTHTGFNRDPDITPDGKKLVYTHEKKGKKEKDYSSGAKVVLKNGEKREREEIYFVDLEKWTSINVSDHREADFQPSIDDKGENVTFTSERYIPSEIYRRNMITWELTNESNNESWDYQSFISGNGKKVLYVSQDDWESAICLKDIKKDSAEIIEKDRVNWYKNPQSNYDATRIIWEKTIDKKIKNKRGIYLKDKETNTITRLSDNKGSYEKPSISQDGRYASWSEIKKGVIYVYSIETKKQIKLKGYPKNKGGNYLSKIRPDGIAIATTTDSEQNQLKWRKHSLFGERE